MRTRRHYTQIWLLGLGIDTQHLTIKVSTEEFEVICEGVYLPWSLDTGGVVEKEWMRLRFGWMWSKVAFLILILLGRRTGQLILKQTGGEWGGG